MRTLLEMVVFSLSLIALPLVGRAGDEAAQGVAAAEPADVPPQATLPSPPMMDPPPPPAAAEQPAPQAQPEPAPQPPAQGQLQAPGQAQAQPPGQVKPPAGPPAPSGQWVYTQQYGWVWMPYGEAYTYAPPGGYGAPYMYVYTQAWGWEWLAAPWVWGYGPWPYFGVYGPGRFAWYGWGWWRYPGRWHFAPEVRRSWGPWRGGSWPAPPRGYPSPSRGVQQGGQGGGRGGGHAAPRR